MKKGKDKPIKVSPSGTELVLEKDETPAVAEPKSVKHSPYDDGYKSGFKDGTARTFHGFIATVEQKLAEHDGYKDLEKWRREATIPAWWIAVLMTDLAQLSERIKQ